MDTKPSTSTRFGPDEIADALQEAELEGPDLEESLRAKCLEYGLDHRELAEVTIEASDGDLPMAAMLSCGIVAGLALAVSFGHVPSADSLEESRCDSGCMS